MEYYWILLETLDDETATSLKGQAEDNCLSKFSHANDKVQFRFRFR